jgi:hypothetical protein
MRDSSTSDLMFDEDLSVGVASLISQRGTPAVCDHYEVGMCQVRIDPTDPTDRYGWVVVPGETPNGLPGWVLLSTVAETNASGTRHFYTADDETPSIYPHITDLNLMLNAPLDAVADTVLATIKDLR